VALPAWCQAGTGAPVICSRIAGMRGMAVSADPEAAMHAVILTLPVASSLDWIVLATDGAAETARHLGLDDWNAIARSDQARLSALLQHCDEWQESADPDGRQFPRAKRHDDKAIATICLS
jgi:hypothetical protein